MPPYFGSLSNHNNKLYAYMYPCSVVTPEQVSYSDNSALSNGATLNNVTQLGPAVDVSFTIRNSGPSRISEIQLDVSWPLNGSLTGENYYLYVTSIKVLAIFSRSLIFTKLSVVYYIDS